MSLLPRITASPITDPVEVPVTPADVAQENFLAELGVPTQRSRPRYGSRWSRLLKWLKIT